MGREHKLRESGDMHTTTPRLTTNTMIAVAKATLARWSFYCETCHMGLMCPDAVKTFDLAWQHTQFHQPNYHWQ